MYLCVFVGSLWIRQALESDEGRYECVAKNSLGVAYSYGANLYVRGTFQRVRIVFQLRCNIVEVTEATELPGIQGCSPWQNGVEEWPP